MIAREYLSTWFAVDIISVIPFDIIFNMGGFNRVTRIARIGKLYRLMRLIKIIRVTKIAQTRKTVISKISEKMQIDIGVERLLFLTLIFFVLQHVTACLW